MNMISAPIALFFDMLTEKRYTLSFCGCTSDFHVIKRSVAFLAITCLVLVANRQFGMRSLIFIFLAITISFVFILVMVKYHSEQVTILLGLNFIISADLAELLLEILVVRVRLIRL